MPRPGDGASVAGSTRTTPRLLLILAGVFLVLRVILAFVEKPAPGEPVSDLPSVGPGKRGGGPELVHWVSPDSADRLAAESGKPILYDFAASWCGPCKIMKAELFADTASSAFINETFIPVRVMDRVAEDGRNPPRIDALQKKYEVRAFPTLVVAGRDRKPAVFSGYGGRAETLRELREAVGAP